MSGVILVAGMAKHVPCITGYDVIGIDYGAMICLQNNVSMVVAIGDFDSTSDSEYDLLQQHCEIVKLPAHKNETDTEAAILYALSKGYDDLVLCGALGGRMDHALANLYLMMHRNYPLTIIDEQNRMRCIGPGTYHIKKEDYTYISFLPIEECIITETGVAYPLDHQTIFMQDIYSISNEIIDQEATIELHQGRMIMMETKDR